MKKITVSVSKESYEKLEGLAIKRNQSVEKIRAELIERFAPVSHTMVEEELKSGYEGVGQINLDWANL